MKSKLRQSLSQIKNFRALIAGFVLLVGLAAAINFIPRTQVYRGRATDPTPTSCPVKCPYVESRPTPLASYCKMVGVDCSTCPAGCRPINCDGRAANLSPTPTCTWGAYGASCTAPSCSGCACAPTATPTPIVTGTCGDIAPTGYVYTCSEDTSTNHTCSDNGYCYHHIQVVDNEDCYQHFGGTKCRYYQLTQCGPDKATCENNCRDTGCSYVPTITPPAITTPCGQVAPTGYTYTCSYDTNILPNCNSPDSRYCQFDIHVVNNDDCYWNFEGRKCRYYKIDQCGPENAICESHCSNAGCSYVPTITPPAVVTPCGQVAPTGYTYTCSSDANILPNCDSPDGRYCQFNIQVVNNDDCYWNSGGTRCRYYQTVQCGGDRLACQAHCKPNGCDLTPTPTPTNTPAIPTATRSPTRPPATATPGTPPPTTITSNSLTVEFVDQFTPQPVPTGNSISWSTDYVSLTADDFYILVDGKKFLADTTTPVSLHSDPGNSQYTTLEVEWQENGVEMRLYLYFQKNEAMWWSDEIRTYDGKTAGVQTGNWIYYKQGKYFETAVGNSYENPGGETIESTSADSGFQGRIYFRNLRLIAFNPPQPKLKINVNFFGVQGVPDNPSSLDYQHQKVKLIVRSKGESEILFQKETVLVAYQPLPPDEFVYESDEENLIILPLPPGIYDVFIKGPKHLQRKFKNQNLTAGLVYIGDKYSLAGGDLPLPVNNDFNNLVQDGKVNALDYSFLVNHFNSTETNFLKVGDLNLDGIINTGDTAVLANTLGEKLDEEE